MKKEQINIRLTTNQKEKLQRLAKEFGMTVTDYLIYNSLEKDISGFIRGHEYLDMMNNYLYELNKIGVNFNQLVRKYNTKRGEFSSIETDNLRSEFKIFNNEIEKFKSRLVYLILKLGKEKNDF